MNLVAKEYVAARQDEDGVLILSRFAGASHELPDALVVNPYDSDELAQAIHTALSMPAEERRARMQRMRAVSRRTQRLSLGGKPDRGTCGDPSGASPLLPASATRPAPFPARLRARPGAL
jgi:hypothetical protein